MSPGGPGRFDRLPARPGATPGAPLGDAQGRRALFSTAPAAPALGSVTIDCSSCGQQTVLGPWRAVRALIPSLHLPALRTPGIRSLVRCPACTRPTWVRLRVRL